MVNERGLMGRSGVGTIKRDWTRFDLMSQACKRAPNGFHHGKILAIDQTCQNKLIGIKKVKNFVINFKNQS